MNRADKYGLEMKDVLQQHLSNTAETEIVEDDSPFTDIEIELDGYYEELFQSCFILEIFQSRCPYFTKRSTSSVSTTRH